MNTPPEVILVTASEDGTVRVPCERHIKSAPNDLREDDYVSCPFSGFITVKKVSFQKSWVVIEDEFGAEHFYPPGVCVDVLRPMISMQ